MAICSTRHTRLTVSALFDKLAQHGQLLVVVIDQPATIGALAGRVPWAARLPRLPHRLEPPTPPLARRPHVVDRASPSNAA
jgi:hypothetical protein